MKELLQDKKITNYILIILISAIICIPLFNSSFDITRDDGIQHVCRLMGMYNTINEGQPFLSIMSNFCNGFGYSWNIFYSPLTDLLPLIFKLLGVSFTLCLKIFMYFTIVFSGIFMYKFINSITKNDRTSLIASIIYITVPYHLTDMYIRIAISELTAFVFLPLVFLGLHNILNNEIHKGYYLTIGTIGLILSHSISTYLAAIFCFIYLLSNFKKLKDVKVIKALCINLLVIVLITAFFWAPLLEHMKAAEYEVFIPDRMASQEFLNNNKINLSSLFYTENEKIVFEIGIFIILGILISPFTISKVDKSYLKLYFVFFIFGIICLLLPLKELPIELPSFFSILQFPWRFLEFAAFFLSITTAISLNVVIEKYNLRISWLVIALSIICLLPMLEHIDYSSTFNEKNYINGARVTYNTGRVHAGCASFEYLPQKAFKNKSYIADRTQEVYVLNGKADIKNQYKNNSKMHFEVENVKENTVLELPYIYYLGYEVKLTSNSKVINIDTFESSNGFVAIELSNIDSGKVNVKYTGTFIMKISHLISFISLITFIAYIVYGLAHKRLTMKN